MAAGGPGDHPLTDVIYYDMDVYGREADDLLRTLEPYMSRRELWEWWEKEIGWECDPESALIKIREQFTVVTSRAKRSGWEVR